MLNTEKKPAVFLDRDGTINVEKEYLYRAEDFEFIPNAPEAIRALKDAGYLVVVVTNQSGVARGYYALNDVVCLHGYIQEELSHIGTAVDAFYICPHHPEKGQGEYLTECECRKGRPGMLLQAAEELGIDLENSYMVGDKIADVEAGMNAGCQPILVMTGYGKESKQILTDKNTIVCQDLSAAAGLILNRNDF